MTLAHTIPITQCKDLQVNPRTIFQGDATSGPKQDVGGGYAIFLSN